jgi:putative acetyltransferase
MLTIREDDLSGEAVRGLVALHLAGMNANTPKDHVFALDLSALTAPEITFWSAWDGEAVAGMGALKDLGDGAGEVKSMRTHPDHLRKGVAAALLEQIIGAAKSRGYSRLSLETGTGPPFDAALTLYRRRGFVDGEPFADYVRSPYNQMLHLAL